MGGRLRPAAVGILLALLVPGATVAHRFHVTMAEAEFNAETGRLEVALSVKLDDLERALRLRKDWIDPPAAGNELDSRVATYLDLAWLFVDAEADTQSIVWVGAEYGSHDAWLYFEVPLPSGLEGVVVENRVFLELDPEHLNTVNFRQGGISFTESFSRHESRRRLVLPIQPTD